MKHIELDNTHFKFDLDHFCFDIIDFNHFYLTLILITNIFKAAELKQDGPAEELIVGNDDDMIKVTIKILLFYF